MQFSLPSNLQQKLIAYDPKLKALAREQNQPTETSKKTKYPLGNVPHLIPYEVVRQSMQQQAIDNINTCEVKYRFQEFNTPVDIATPQARLVMTAMLYHYEQCWYAAWLPQRGEDYLFGYALAFKDTAAARKALPREIIDAIDAYEKITVGRTTFYVLRKNVTQDDIKTGQDDIKTGRLYRRTPWRPAYFGSYYQKSREIQRILDKFENTLKEKFPIWIDSRHMFDRICCDEIYKALEINEDLIPEDKRTGWELTINNLIEAFSRRDEVYGPNSYRDHEYGLVIKNLDVWNTPYFRKWMQQELDECISKFNDPDNRKVLYVRRGFKRILRLAEAIHYVKNIWPDCPVDYFQKNIDVLMIVQTRPFCTKVPAEWLRVNMPVSSYFHILNKHYQSRLTNPNNSKVISKELGFVCMYFSDWNDTTTMIDTILSNGIELKAPKRWRLSEFHDYVQAEAWKIKNPNEKLPQDLFPHPVKIDLDDQVWTFIQPIDTHQLAMWGQAVRNCVGAASSYAEGIRKKKHFIVLCMVDGSPQFTIQLRVEMGCMSVDQIRGLSNSVLTSDQKEQYTQAFTLALQALESTLKSN